MEWLRERVLHNAPRSARRVLRTSDIWSHEKSEVCAPNRSRRHANTMRGQLDASVGISRTRASGHANRYVLTGRTRRTTGRHGRQFLHDRTRRRSTLHVAIDKHAVGPPPARSYASETGTLIPSSIGRVAKLSRVAHNPVRQGPARRTSTRALRARWHLHCAAEYNRAMPPTQSDHRVALSLTSRSRCSIAVSDFADKRRAFYEFALIANFSAGNDTPGVTRNEQFLIGGNNP
jgi:hypothetical protein